ncbi:MAG: fatty acid desaturase [Hydrogenophilaceae bacterium]|nr:fatty acid desaturase [Hydrogenophilaceae bacterium]
MLTRTDIRINRLLFATLAALQLFMILLPLTGLSHAWALLPALFTNTFWSLIHEAIHGHLFASRKTSILGGRVLGILYGAPFHVLQRGHLLHHAYSRTPRERTEIYDSRKQNRLAACLRYYAQILGGLYIAEVLTGLLLMLLPASGIRWLSRKLESPDSVVGPLLDAQSQPDKALSNRQDALVILLLFVAAFWLYEEAWPWLTAALMLRAFLISFFDNSYHYATPLDAPQHALNLDAPPWLDLVLLNFNRHGTHHQHPSLGWRALGNQADLRSPRLGLVTALLRQLKGPVDITKLS